MVLLSRVHSSRAFVRRRSSAAFAPPAKDRVSVISDSSYTAAALTNDGWSDDYVVDRFSYLVVRRLLGLHNRYILDIGLACSRTQLCFGLRTDQDPALNPKRNPKPSPNRNDNLFTVGLFGGFRL